MRGIIQLFKRAAGLQGWNIYLGRDPRYLPGRSIILFPMLPATLACGLAGILAIRGDRTSAISEVVDRLRRSVEELRKRLHDGEPHRSNVPDHYLGGSESLDTIDREIDLLKSDDAFSALLLHGVLLSDLRKLSQSLSALAVSEEERLDRKAGALSTEQAELANGFLSRLRDASWSLERDLLGALERGNDFFGGRGHLSRGIAQKFRKIDLLLNALDRLEVRGRDSAGIQIALALENRESWEALYADLEDCGLSTDLARRSAPGDLRNGSVTVSGTEGGHRTPFLAFTYKTASLTGELGENTRFLREAITTDGLLLKALEKEARSQMYLVHTRWASVGSITTENCHPLNNFVLRTDPGLEGESSAALKNYPFYGEGAWTIDAALNGDVDNYQALREVFRHETGLDIDHRVSTDTKIIPLQVDLYLRRGLNLEEAFRKAVNDFEGSQAIALQSSLEPGKVFLALRGSGQSLYVGFRDDQYVYASELYGMVEQTSNFIKLDGERLRVAGDPSTKGQIIILDDSDGYPGGIRAAWYDGTPLELDSGSVKKAEITTRDIDRGGHPHFLLKEILDAPLSMRKTLRGKYRIDMDSEGNPRLSFNLGEDVLPGRLRDALLKGGIRTIFIVGQGTAAVAGEAVADAFRRYCGRSPFTIQALRATELSGFYLKENLEDTLVIAVTQSGTTTDTNRAVAMARKRGAHLIAIVNRRQSDITNQVEGVLYTSDGRDIEMSVASTKAFYSQVAAGCILAVCFGHITGELDDAQASSALVNLERIPGLMERVISRRKAVEGAVGEAVTSKRHWAVVGSGPNKVASDEVRIKLSELCYKTISSDYVEDKKHIDLSSEPLVLVMAAGSPEPVAGDIVKDTAIFKAHAGVVVVIAEEGETRFRGIADAVITVPHAEYPGPVILNTLAGHLWGYYAARAIDGEARPFKEFRGRLAARKAELDGRRLSLFEQAADEELHRMVDSFSSVFQERRNLGCYGSLKADTAADIALLLKYCTGRLPLEEFRNDFKGKRVSPSPLDQLDIILGRAVDELSRPIDAIRHQAKTVTVGTSRKEEIPEGIIFDYMKSLNFTLENLSGRNGFALARIQGGLRAVRGYMLYDVRDLDFEGKPRESSRISIARRDGVTVSMTSRVEKDRRLMGTKKTIVSTGKIHVGRGTYDGAPIVIVPLLGERAFVSSLLLLHVDFHDELPLERKKDILGEKFEWIQDHVSEYTIPWDDAMIESFPPAFLLGETAEAIAGAIVASVEKKGG